MTRLIDNMVKQQQICEGDDLLNADRGSKERIAQIYVVAGGNRVKVEEPVSYTHLY